MTETASLQKVRLPDHSLGTCFHIQTVSSLYRLYLVDPATGLAVCHGGTKRAFREPRLGMYLGASRGRQVVQPLVVQVWHGLAIKPYLGESWESIRSSEVHGIRIFSDPAFSEVSREILREQGLAVPPPPDMSTEDDKQFAFVMRVLESLPEPDKERAIAFADTFCLDGQVLLAELFKGAVAQRRLSAVLDLLTIQFTQYWGSVAADQRGRLETEADRRRALQLFQFAGIPFPARQPVAA